MATVQKSAPKPKPTRRVTLPPDIGGHRVKPKPTLEQLDRR